MFTGIIQSQAVLRKKETLPRQVRLTLEVVGKNSRLKVGESVALDGVCLTAARVLGRKFRVDVIPETLESTTLGEKTPGERLNFERALRVGERLGGHWVSGHIDGVGSIRKIERRGENFRLKIEAPADTMSRLVGKGSIAVDGVSLTLQEVQKRLFVIGLTPLTFRVTTFQWKHEGDRVNLEVDLFAKLAEHFLSGRRAFPFSGKDLQRQGF